MTPKRGAVPADEAGTVSPRPGGVSPTGRDSSQPTRTVYGYLRVSTDTQAEEGGGLDAQRSAITGAGWQVDEWITDGGYSGKNLKRPGMDELLERLQPGDVVVAAKLDRITRSPRDFYLLGDTARRGGWSLVVLDAIDMTTPAGEMQAGMLALMAQYERRIISARTKAGLAAKKAAGTLRGPVGRPPSIPLQVRETIRGMSKQGLSPGAIAKALNESQTPTAAGGRCWYESTVRRVLAQASAPR